jgi:hypothetical protein
MVTKLDGMTKEEEFLTRKQKDTGARHFNNMTTLDYEKNNGGKTAHGANIQC